MAAFYWETTGTVPERVYRQGEIHRAWIETARWKKARPVVIVSRDELNKGQFLTVIPFTSKRLEERRRQKNNVYFQKGAFGLTEDCVAQCEAIGLIPKFDIVPPTGPPRTVSAPVLKAIQAAIAYAVGMAP